MIPNRIFNKVINERRIKNNARMRLNKLFEYVLKTANDENDSVNDLEVSPEYINRPLANIFDNVINQCANENTLDYATISVNKKSVPFNHLMQ